MRCGSSNVSSSGHHATSHLVPIGIQSSLQKHGPSREYPRLTPRHTISQFVQVVFLFSLGNRGGRGLDGHVTAVEHRHDDLGASLCRIALRILLGRDERAGVDRVRLAVRIWNLLHADDVCDQGCRQRERCCRSERRRRRLPPHSARSMADP